MNKVLSKIFTPLSFSWEMLYRFRRFAYNYGIFQQLEVKVPIISVGNITFGGTGKTPFTLWLANYLYSKNKKTMILTRGYKGDLENNRGILRSGVKLGFNAVEYGDEALLLAKNLKESSVVIGKHRSDNLEYYFETEKPDVVILDDGHQHLQLGRKLNFVLFDALLPLKKYKVAPLGYLREGANALKDADVIILGHCDQAKRKDIEDLKTWILKYADSKVPLCEIFYKPKAFFNTSFIEKYDIDQIKGKNAICVAGIASPISFFSQIKSLGCNVIKNISFPDHHYYSVNELQTLIEIAEKKDALLITTEKDIVKIRRLVESDKIVYLAIDIGFISGEEVLNKKIAEAIY